MTEPVFLVRAATEIEVIVYWEIGDDPVHAVRLASIRHRTDNVENVVDSNGDPVRAVAPMDLSDRREWDATHSPVRTRRSRRDDLLTLTSDQIRRAADLAKAAKLAESGDVTAARMIFGRYGISHAIVEINVNSRVEK